MQDRIDSSTWPTSRGPWPPVIDSSRMYDSGALWCLNALGHPGAEQDYPNSEKHFPFDECQTPGFWVEDVQAELDGPALDLAIYGARPFQFGAARDLCGPGRARLVLDLCELESGNGRVRFSIGQGEALLLASHLRRVVGIVNDVNRLSTT